MCVCDIKASIFGVVHLNGKSVFLILYQLYLVYYTAYQIDNVGEKSREKKE